MIALAVSYYRSMKADRKAVAMLEYALIAALVSIAAVPMLSSLGTKIGDQMTIIAGQL